MAQDRFKCRVGRSWLKMISKTKTYAMAVAFIASETAFGLQLDARPTREMNNIASKLAQTSSNAYDAAIVTPEKVLITPKPKPEPDCKPDPKPDCKEENKGDDCCDGEPRVCLNLGNPWSDKCGTHTKTLGILVDASTCNNSKEQHCHLPTSHIGCTESRCSCSHGSDDSDSDGSEHSDSSDSDSDSDGEDCKRGRKRSRSKGRKDKKCKKSKSGSKSKGKSGSKDKCKDERKDERKDEGKPKPKPGPRGPGLEFEGGALPSAENEDQQF